MMAGSGCQPYGLGGSVLRSVKPAGGTCRGTFTAASGRRLLQQGSHRSQPRHVIWRGRQPSRRSVRILRAYVACPRAHPPAVAMAGYSPRGTRGSIGLPADQAETGSCGRRRRASRPRTIGVMATTTPSAPDKAGTGRHHRDPRGQRDQRSFLHRRPDRPRPSALARRDHRGRHVSGRGPAHAAVPHPSVPAGGAGRARSDRVRTPYAGLDSPAFFGTGFLSSLVSVTLGGAIIATISAALGAVR